MPIQNSYLKVLVVIVILPIITYIAHNLWTFSKAANPLDDLHE